MKKLIFIALLFIGIGTTGFAQEKNTNNLSEEITQAERIVDKYVGKAVEGFNTLIDEVTPLAEEGFNMVVKLQKAKGIAELLMAFLFIIIIGIIGFIQYKAYKNDWDEDPQIAVFVFGGILQIVALLIGAAFVYDGILYLIAPEWFAIKEILGMFN